MSRDIDELIYMLERRQDDLREKMIKAREAGNEKLERQLFHTSYGLAEAIDIVREWID